MNLTKLTFLVIFSIPIGLFLIFPMIADTRIFEIVPGPAGSPYAISTGWLNTDESSAGTTLSVSEIRDQMGNIVMSDMAGMGPVMISPGDAITMRLQSTNGHISHFELTDPESGQPVSETHPTTTGSPPVFAAELTLHIPQGATPGRNVSVPWQAEVFVVKEQGVERNGSVETHWFNVVEPPLTFSGTMTLPLATPEMRAGGTREAMPAIVVKFLTYFVLASVITGIVVLAGRMFFVLVFAACVFTGVTVDFIFSFSFAGYLYGIAYLLYWGGTLAVVWLVGRTMFRILKKYHSLTVQPIAISPKVD